MSGQRDWLILSVKWSQGQDDFVWYCTNESGYTKDLMHAGRYTEHEAKDTQRGSSGDTLAVPMSLAFPLMKMVCKVETTEFAMDAFRAASGVLGKAQPA